ncbi:hypothetical protein DW086_11375 [Harryflintia acetispora]|nr:hypothetical protein DW086_11375 [Harryflintia acetispora]
MRHYYQQFVEHCFKLSTRYPKANDPVQQLWHDRVHEWLNSLPESDRQLIIDVFGKRGERYVRLNLDNRTQQRLDRLETDFAIKNNLASEKTKEDFNNEQHRDF